MNNGPGSLNRMYRLVWSEAVGGFVAVAENTSARGKRASTRTASTLLISAVLTGGAWAAGPPEPAAHALPTGGQVAAGQVRIDQSGSRMDVHQGTSRAIVNWQSFDIGAAAHVNFNQPNASAIALNRVLSANPSSIFGKLTANGQVMLINPNGIVFGASARVDVGGIAASTLQMADSDFLAGRFRFGRGDATGAVVNQGEIRAADGGYVALLAPEVRNEGVLQAHLGTVALAAGDAVSFDISGSGKLGVKVDPASVNALVENRHLIQADGGQVILSAGAAQRLAEQAIAMGDGAATALVHDNGTVRLVSAGGSVSAASGQVKIEGSLVDVSGAVSASGAAGGQVSVSADFVSQSGQLRAEGSTGRGGEVSVQAQDVIQTASAVLSADGANAGGRVAVLGGPAAGGEGQGQGVVYSSATLSARGTGQGAKGGQIDMSADSVQLRAALLDASGDAGGGKIRVGGGYQGLGADLGNARAVGVNGSTLLRADAIAYLRKVN